MEDEEDALWVCKTLSSVISHENNAYAMEALEWGYLNVLEYNAHSQDTDILKEVYFSLNNISKSGEKAIEMLTHGVHAGKPNDDDDGSKVWLFQRTLELLDEENIPPTNVIEILLFLISVSAQGCTDVVEFCVKKGLLRIIRELLNPPQLEKIYEKTLELL